MRKLFQHFLKKTSGATSVEYGLIACLIAMGIMVGLNTFSSAFNKFSDDLKPILVVK